MRFSEEELSLLEELATLSDMPIRAYVRHASLKGKLPRNKRKLRYLSAEDKELLYKVYGALRNSGLVTTFRIVANALSKGQAISTVIEKSALMNACADMKALRSAIEKALNVIGSS